MADSNIFQQYLAPPKSVMEYSAELDQADERRLAQQQNALSLAANRQKFDEGQQASQRNALLRAALGALPQGATDEQRMNAMRATGTPEGYAAADALSKSLIEQRKGNAAAKKDEGEAADKDYKLRIAKHDQALRDMSSFQSPQEALASLQQHVASGEVPAEQANMFAQQLQTMNVADFPKWQLGMVQRLMSAKDDMSYRAPDANTVANNVRIKAEGAANRENQIKVQKMIGERQDKSGDDGSGFTDATRMRFAQQAVDSGDYSWMKNVGRGTQGAKDLRGIQNAITDYAASKGMSAGELSAKLAEFEAMRSGMKVSANISAKIENAAAEADQLAPLAIEAGRNVARSGFLPFGRVQAMFNNQTNDPNMNKFATANIGLATAYAGAMARGGKATVSDNEHARELLSTAKSQEAYEAIVSQMQQEIKAARAAPQHVRENLRNEISGGGNHAAAPAPAKPGGGKPSLSDIFGH
jgi:hypothetical protein